LVEVILAVLTVMVFRVMRIVVGMAAVDENRDQIRTLSSEARVQDHCKAVPTHLGQHAGKV
jgi:hypothetical protein